MFAMMYTNFGRLKNTIYLLCLYCRSETKVSKKQKKEKPEKEMLDRGKEKERLEKKIAIMDSEGFIEVTRVRCFPF